MKNIKDYNLDALKEEIVSMGEKGFRADRPVQRGVLRLAPFKGRNVIWWNDKSFIRVEREP